MTIDIQISHPCGCVRRSHPGARALTVGSKNSSSQITLELGVNEVNDEVLKDRQRLCFTVYASQNIRSSINIRVTKWSDFASQQYCLVDVISWRCYLDIAESHPNNIPVQSEMP